MNEKAVEGMYNIWKDNEMDECIWMNKQINWST